MGLVQPFRALRYDREVAGPLDRLIAPPWDVISKEDGDRLAAASAHNVIRLIRPREPADAGRRLAEWAAAGVLRREERAAVWRLEEEFVGPDGVARVRHGLVARVRLEPYEAGIVLPHERIFAAQSERRLELLRATRTKLSPVLALHDGPPPPAAQGPPGLEVSFSGTTARLWRVDDPAGIAAAVATVRAPLVIADGHHRYDAALRFHREEGSPETAHVLAVLVSGRDDGLTIFPTHRLVEGVPPPLNGDLRLTRVAGGVREGLARLDEVGRDHPAFVVLSASGVVLAEAPGASDPVERLDVAAVDRLALERVAFTPFVAEAEAAVASGRVGAALLVRAPTVADVQEIARSGRTMPQKSTYFYPKLASGLLFSPFDE
ncbi:MAG: DUF1015 domain-containing protein [Thermoleophilia bacterium]|nr:DUF1015 domain-containing protein [Thermoleophilia bacterium]